MHFLGAPLKGRLMALSTNIRLGWKDLPRTSALASYGRKKFYSIGPWMSLQATKLSLQASERKGIGEFNSGGLGQQHSGRTLASSCQGQRFESRSSRERKWRKINKYIQGKLLSLPTIIRLSWKTFKIVLFETDATISSRNGYSIVCLSFPFAQDS